MQRLLAIASRKVGIKPFSKLARPLASSFPKAAVLPSANRIQFFHSATSTFAHADQVDKTLIDTMNSINATPRDDTGIWYFDDYEQYCAKTGKVYKDKYKLGFADPEYWQVTKPFTFKINEGKKPADALRAYLNGFTIADCGNMLVACQYASLLKIFGDEKFNLMFSGVTPLIIPQQIIGSINTAGYFYDFTAKSKRDEQGHLGDRPINTGEMGHIKGLINYHIKHPAGTAGGWNVICVGKNEKGEDLFVGFGPDFFKDKPLTERELYEIFVRTYNWDRNHFDRQVISSSTNPSLYDMVKHEVPEKMDLDRDSSFIRGYLPGSAIGPVFSRINKFAEMDLSRVSKNFAHAFYTPSLVFSSRPDVETRGSRLR